MCRRSLADRPSLTKPPKPPQGPDRSQVLARLNAAQPALGEARDLLEQQA